MVNFTTVLYKGGCIFFAFFPGNFQIISIKARSAIDGILQSGSQWSKEGTDFIHPKQREDCRGYCSFCSLNGVGKGLSSISQQANAHSRG